MGMRDTKIKVCICTYMHTLTCGFSDPFFSNYENDKGRTM